MITYILLDLVILIAILYLSAFATWSAGRAPNNIMNPIFTPKCADWFMWAGAFLWSCATALTLLLVSVLATLVGMSVYFTINPPS